MMRQWQSVLQGRRFGGAGASRQYVRARYWALRSQASSGTTDLVEGKPSDTTKKGAYKTEEGIDNWPWNHSNDRTVRSKLVHPPEKESRKGTGNRERSKTEAHPCKKRPLSDDIDPGHNPCDYAVADSKKKVTSCLHDQVIEPSIGPFVRRSSGPVKTLNMVQPLDGVKMIPKVTGY